MALSEKYSGNGGSDIAYGQSAELLVSLFRLKKGMPMETKAGAVILNLAVYLDSFDLKHSKRKTLGYSSRGELCRALVTLEAFFSWAEIDLGLRGLQRLAYRVILRTVRLSVFSSSQCQGKMGFDTPSIEA